MTVVLLLFLAFLTFILGFSLGLRRGLRHNLKLYTDTLGILGVMLRNGETDRAREFIVELIN